MRWRVGDIKPILTSLEEQLLALAGPNRGRDVCPQQLRP